MEVTKGSLFRPGFFLSIFGAMLAVCGTLISVLVAYPDLADILVQSTFGNEVRKAVTLSAAISTIIVGLLLFYIGFDKMRQKLAFERLMVRGQEKILESQDPK